MPSLPEQIVNRPFDRVSKSVPQPVRKVAFWSAISLPIATGALLATGLDTTTKTLAFFTLLVCNACALVVGKRYDP